MAGAAASALLLAIGAPVLVAARDEERSLTIHNIHTKETVSAVFKRNGRFVESGLEKLSRVMRDHRRDEATRMDPELMDLLWQIHAELGSKEPIHLISGYRSRATNEQLRRTVGGQASESRHILGKAADVHFPDVPMKRLRYSALIQERGGVGYYPTSALPFVHVDTDRVRSWPRLPRHELALLFPSGSTQHLPAEGGPLTRDDVKLAKGSHPELAQQVALFLGERQGLRSGTAVAEARPPARTTDPQPAIAALPRPLAAPVALPAPSLVERPKELARHVPQVPSSDRLRLSELATLASLTPQLVAGPAPARRPEAKPLPSLNGASLPAPPEAQGLRPVEPQRQVAALGPARSLGETLADAGRFGWGGWIPAPAYDDEHPEELSYRPFPIVPYLTETASQPLMSELTPHDIARTVEILDQPDTAPTLRFRPSAQFAGAIWAQQFTGSASGLDKLREAEAAEVRFVGGLTSRPVKTSGR